MPLSTERVNNKPLSGKELGQVVLADIKAVIERDAMFSEFAAFGRVAYKVTVELEMANPTYPKHETVAQAPITQLEGTQLEGVPPLRKVEGKVGKVHKTRERLMDNPNLSRMANDLPITIQTTLGGEPITQTVSYDKGEFEPPNPPIDRDLVEENV